MPDKLYALTLVAPEGQNILTTPALLAALEKTSQAPEQRWLKEGDALELLLTEDEKHLAKAALLEIIENNPIDYALTPLKDRRKKLLISDMDSTIIEQECIDEIAFMAGIKPKIAEITERAMRGELDFEKALNERVGLLKGLPLSALETVISERIALSKGAKTLVKTMASTGAHCALVSGGFTFFTEKIAALTGFHTHRANTLEFADGKLTGHVVPPILGSAAKREALITLAAEHAITLPETLAVGDGANDLEMITLSGLGIAYRAKPIVAAKADAAVNHTDLTSLLYFQGYSHNEFVLD